MGVEYIRTKTLLDLFQQIGASLCCEEETEGSTKLYHKNEKEKWIEVTKWYRKCLLTRPDSLREEFWSETQGRLLGLLRAKISQEFHTEVRSILSCVNRVEDSRTVDTIVCYWILTGKEKISN